ncbi:Beta-ketoacyl synthase, partial [Metarhizium majus ARSEF 297]
MDATPGSAKPIAIIGMGFRLPGGISSDYEYWDVLVNKKNGRCRVPATRYNVDGFSGGKTQTQSLATEYGYFLQTELSSIDKSFFSMKPAEATVSGPQLRLLMEVAWECMESAGQTHKLVGSDTGVFVGVFGEDWHNMLHRDDLMMNTYSAKCGGLCTIKHAVPSVKPNLGHGEGAAALTSAIKCVLALENKTIPPNVNFVTPNPSIPFEEYNLQVPGEPIPWPEGRSERLSINSFGFGGANGHVRHTSNMVSDCDSAVPEVSWRRLHPMHAGCVRYQRFLKVSSHHCPFARSEKSIKSRIATFEAYMKNSPAAMNDIAYALGEWVAHMSHRAFAIHHNDIHQSLEFSVGNKVIPGREKDAKVAFVFTGQGAQWSGMGRELVRSSATFRSDMRNMDRVLQSLPTAPKWTLEDVLCREEEEEADTPSCHSAQLSQPLCTAVQIALVNFLSKCGIRPSAVVGHSSGEIAAAYAAGAINYSEAILCAYFRGLATTKLTTHGSMAAIGLGRDHVAPHLVDGAQIACENSPKSVTISGDSEAVCKTMESIGGSNKDTFMRKLKVQVAYHSSHMSTIAAEYEDMMKSHHTSIQDWTCPFYSSLYGKLVDSKVELGPSYWKDNMLSPVLFFSAARQLLDDLPEITTLVEIGPHPALQEPVRQIIESRSPQPSVTYLGTLVRDKPAHDAILTTLGRLHTMGHDINFSFINPVGSVVKHAQDYVGETGAAVTKMYASLATSENMAVIFTGRVKPLEICLEEKGLESFYIHGQSMVSPNDFLRLCAHSKPTLSVLEIGAGMGATTEAMLRAGFFVMARDKFAKWDGVEYQVLDIERDPAAQGFEPHSFDLIVASNRTANPPGWWAQKEDSREAGPLVSVERWHKELLSAGFSGADIVKLDDEHPDSATAHMTSTALPETKESLGLTFLYRQFRHEFASRLAARLQFLGHQVHWLQLGSEDNAAKAESTGRDIISTMELEGSSFVDGISETDYRRTMKLVKHHKRGILWLTRPAQFACAEPGYGASTGLMRSHGTNR